MLNNLLTVSQGVQTRTFVYDALSRLKSAASPESGTILYAYDPNGNLTSKQDARSITTSYAYDALNRVTQRTYSDSTLPVYYNYDNLSHAKGKLTKVTTGSGSTPFSVTEYTEFDAVGRVKKSRQTTDGTVYNEMEYTYNLSGALLEEKYPSGRIVRNVLDNEGDLSMVQSKRNADYGFWNYANHFTYTAAGAVASMQLGNGTWEKTAFNSRLQPTQIALGKVQNATDLLKLDYTYGVVESGTLNTAKNNGNIQSQTITVPTVGTSTGFTAVQTYSYDSLNRIDDATEKIGSTETWKQDYTFDRYGNRNFVEANTTTIPKNCGTSPNFTVCAADRKVFNPSISPNTNRINLDQDGDSVNDYAIDNSGNTTRDALVRKFTYDAENKQTKVESIDSNGNVTGTIGEYFYDGDGRRVKKHVPSTGETTVFVYNASSRLVAEYSTILNETPQVAYLTNDHLGSPRINTNENGSVISRHDYRPYGEEITERTHTQYIADTIRKEFTGYERDRETDLDFAQARFYESGYGRFTSPDDFLNMIYPAKTQNSNLYVFVSNNPLRYIDPDGQIEKNPDGTVKFDANKVDGKDEVERREVARAKLKDGRTVIISAEYKIGKIYTDKKNAVDAMKLNDKPNIKITFEDSDGKQIEVRSVSLADLKKNNKLDPVANCFGTTFGQGEVWINSRDTVKAIIDDDGSKETDTPKAGDAGLYFSSNEVDFSTVGHAVRVSELGDAGEVRKVTSKDGSQPIRQAASGPGPNSAWNDKNSKLRYFTQNTASQ
ncbi:MAG: hypothetical protein IPJ30_10585 [Acidobacteria bacterium]|nr:hypothetical protein [Acidobacteriota bacterium]